MTEQAENIALGGGARAKVKIRKCSAASEHTKYDQWECDTCQITSGDKKCRMIECEYCEAKRCIKCLKITDTTYKSLGDKPDFPWFCDKSIGKSMKCIREEREIEKRCGEFLEGFRQEVNTKLDNMQA